MPTPSGNPGNYVERSLGAVVPQDEFEEMLYSPHAEIESFGDLMQQRGSPIPALFNIYYKFVQNPSSVSIDTFKRMIDTDDTIGSGVDFLTTCLASRLGRYTHDNPEITEFVNKALEKIEGGFHNSVKEMLSATWAGFSVQELVWADDPIGFIVKKLVSLPPTTILFETERTGEITPDGILQYQRNWYPFGMGLGGYGSAIGVAGSSIGGMRPDAFAKYGDLPFPVRTANPAYYMSIRIPKQKVLHYSFDAQGKFGNPYGRSLLRRAYKYYVLKDAILQMLSIALDRKGTPLMIVYADPNTTLIDESKSAPGANPKGQYAGISADQAAREAFRNVHNDTVMILPGKKGEIYDTDMMDQSPNTSDFIAALDFCNKSIMRALLIPSLIFTNGDGTGSFALGQEHAKTFDKVCDSILEGVKQVLLQQLITPMVKFNFPRQEWEKQGFGSFTRKELSQEEIDKQMEGFEKAVGIGAMDMAELNDLNQVRETLSLEPRTEVFPQPVTPVLPGAEGDEGAVDEQGDEDQEDGKAEPEKKPAPGTEKKTPEKSGEAV